MSEHRYRKPLEDNLYALAGKITKDLSERGFRRVRVDIDVVAECPACGETRVLYSRGAAASYCCHCRTPVVDPSAKERHAAPTKEPEPTKILKFKRREPAKRSCRHEEKET